MSGGGGMGIWKPECMLWSIVGSRLHCTVLIQAVAAESTRRAKVRFVCLLLSGVGRPARV